MSLSVFPSPRLSFIALFDCQYCVGIVHDRPAVSRLWRFHLVQAGRVCVCVVRCRVSWYPLAWRLVKQQVMRPTIMTWFHTAGLGKVAVLSCFGWWLMWCALIRWQLPFAHNMDCASCRWQVRPSNCERPESAQSILKLFAASSRSIGARGCLLPKSSLCDDIISRGLRFMPCVPNVVSGKRKRERKDGVVRAWCDGCSFSFCSPPGPWMTMT